ncbi:META domain-containing protein [bacterium]|nr:META domain-containing protein [bacterium]
MKPKTYLPFLVLIFAFGCVTPTNNSSEGAGAFDLISGFKATGNEPFWSLEIVDKDQLIFKSIGNPPFEISAPTPSPKQVDPSETRYRFDADGTSLQVSIKREECQDGMSGKKSPYEVSVSAKSKKMDSPVIFNGCGQYTGDYRIHDIWALRELDGKKVERGGFQKGDPSLEIQIEAQRVFGYAGCNEFQGNLVMMAGNTLEMGPLAATRMACPQLDFEQKYIAALSSGPLTYSLKKLKLTLKNKEHKMVFQKVD